MADEEKKISQVQVVMGGTESYIDMCAGRMYELNPGVPTNLPVEAADLWFGWPTIESQKGEEARKEQKRCKNRRGGIYPPVVSIEPIDEVNLVEKLKQRAKKARSKATATVAEVEETEEPAEEEFADLPITKTAPRRKGGE